MACPDELTLDLWLAGALPADEAAEIATHVGECALCAAAAQAAGALEAELQAAVALDAEELAYLSGLALASPWRSRPAAPPWGWIALVGVVGGYLAWLAAGPAFGAVAAAAVQIGLGTAPLYLAIGLLLALGQALLDLARHPALDLSQPLLALLALALLLWPRAPVLQRSTRA
jgi:anti-sigma factor RsiW